MIIERTDTEIIVRLPLETNLKDSQSILDFLKYKEIVSTSKANNFEIDQLIDTVKSEIHKSYSKGK